MPHEPQGETRHTIIRLFGPFQAEANGRSVGGFRSQKTIALLAYLIVENRPFHRNHLASLLWGHMPEKEARGELRRALHNLTSRLSDCLKIEKEIISLSPSATYTVDILQFQQFSAEEDPTALDKAVLVYRGPFLVGLWLDDSPDFEQWLSSQRERWQKQAAFFNFIMTNLLYHLGPPVIFSRVACMRPQFVRSVE